MAIEFDSALTEEEKAELKETLTEEEKATCNEEGKGFLSSKEKGNCCSNTPKANSILMFLSTHGG